MYSNTLSWWTKEAPVEHMKNDSEEVVLLRMSNNELVNGEQVRKDVLDSIPKFFEKSGPG